MQTGVTQEPPGPAGRDAIVAQLFGLFRTAGFEGVSISAIARATGLGKSSLYHHFPGGKADMSDAVFDLVARWLDGHVVAALRAPVPWPERVDAMLAAVDDLYCGGAAPCLIASMLVGAEGRPAPPPLTAAVTTWRDALATALVETGAPAPDAERRANDALARIQGALIIARALVEGTPFRQALAAIRADLLATA